MSPTDRRHGLAQRPARQDSTVPKTRAPIERDHIDVASEAMMVKSVVEDDHLSSESSDRSAPDEIPTGTDEYRHTRSVCREQKRLVTCLRRPTQERSAIAHYDDRLAPAPPVASAGKNHAPSPLEKCAGQPGGERRLR